MTVSRTVPCVVCGEEVRIEIDGLHVLPDGLNLRAYCPDHAHEKQENGDA